MKFMKTLVLFVAFILFALALAASGQSSNKQTSGSTHTNSLALSTEKHLANMRQLSFGGENAEAYWDGNGSRLIFQSKRDGRACDQIYTMSADGSNVKMVSTGKGRTTCSYFYPNKERILFSSTHQGNEACPTPPDFSHGYVWAIYPTYDIYTARPDGTDIKQLTRTPG